MLPGKGTSKLHIKIPYLISTSQFLKILRENLIATGHIIQSHFSTMPSILLDRTSTHHFYFHTSVLQDVHFIILPLSSNLYLADPWKPYSCATCFWRHISCSLPPGGRCHSLPLLRHFFPPTLPKLPAPLRIQGIRQVFLCDKIY